MSRHSTELVEMISRYPFGRAKEIYVNPTVRCKVKFDPADLP